MRCRGETLLVAHGREQALFLLDGGVIYASTCSHSLSRKKKKSILLWTATTEISAGPEERRSSRLNSLDCTHGLWESQQRSQQPALCRHGSEVLPSLHTLWMYTWKLRILCGACVWETDQHRDRREVGRYWRGSPGPDPRQRRLIPLANNGKHVSNQQKEGVVVNTRITWQL